MASLLTDSITLADSAAANKVFALLSRNDQKVIRYDTASTSALPRNMVVDHSQSKDQKTGVFMDRSLVQFSNVAQTAGGIFLPTGIVNVTFNVPRDPAFTATMVADLWAFQKNLLTVDTITALLRGAS